MLKRLRRLLAYWLAEVSDWISPDAAEARRADKGLATWRRYYEAR